jgi:hypothetical protein
MLRKKPAKAFERLLKGLQRPLNNSERLPKAFKKILKALQRHFEGF